MSLKTSKGKRKINAYVWLMVLTSKAFLCFQLFCSNVEAKYLLIYRQ